MPSRKSRSFFLFQPAFHGVEHAPTRNCGMLFSARADYVITCQGKALERESEIESQVELFSALRPKGPVRGMSLETHDAGCGRILGERERLTSCIACMPANQWVNCGFKCGIE
jgi:hypothetical protein